MSARVTRENLVRAIDEALLLWRGWQSKRTIIGSYPPDRAIYEPIKAAIEALPEYEQVAGQSLFSGFAGVVITAERLAPEALYFADRLVNNSDGKVGSALAADWLIQALRTEEADGILTIAVWGISVDEEAEMPNDIKLLPFAQLRDSFMKRRLSERARKLWDSAVWHGQNFFDAPGAALILPVAKFPYIGDPGVQFTRLADTARAALPVVAFLQTYCAGQPIAAASWFEYVDDDLDFNQPENFLNWIVPEIIPRVSLNVKIDASEAAEKCAALMALPSDWREDLLRSMKRFELSLCRQEIVDQVVDLAVAFEILTSGPGEAPISWKASVRSAQLIGGTVGQRLNIRSSIEDLYKLRNRGAHGASLKATERKAHETALAEARQVYRQALRSIVSMAARPDWRTLEIEPRARS